MKVLDRQSQTIMGGGYPERGAVGMRDGGNRGKPKAGFPPVPIAPWKSRPPREISTFPQLGRAADGKSGKPKPGFPLFPRAVRAYNCGSRPKAKPKPGALDPRQAAGSRAKKRRI